MTCTLCREDVHKSFKGINDILFWQCNNCNLIFKDVEFLPSPEAEKLRYSQHNNTPDCKGYVEHLQQAIEPTLPFIYEGMTGLDFGCGPNPVLSQLMSDSGYECYHYDPFFFPELPDERLEFMFATECFEHFFNPGRELNLITSLLIPAGVLTIITERWKDTTDFNTWWYARDNTHVCFFHDRTIEFICEHYGYETMHDDGEKLVILKKLVVGR
ncbi:class I SAM-dependent methyltransferase [Alkaliflexus imshenetskii]|uniref:class I SAM-dependent methyltransferase n=1 Tax=Alkaliflexus imshenetskii TaxID=286730 RepID=UPI0004B059DA|nr:class I SAM-dependent methyltransferase [Alkaliflexus imshenetskii]